MRLADGLILDDLRLVIVQLAALEILDIWVMFAQIDFLFFKFNLFLYKSLRLGAIGTLLLYKLSLCTFKKLVSLSIIKPWTSGCCFVLLKLTVPVSLYSF